jgi:hypothetical protein
VIRPFSAEPNDPAFIILYNYAAEKETEGRRPGQIPGQI